jgi:hypothetical protein
LCARLIKENGGSISEQTRNCVRRNATKSEVVLLFSAPCELICCIEFAVILEIFSMWTTSLIP